MSCGVVQPLEIAKGIRTVFVGEVLSTSVVRKVDCLDGDLFIRSRVYSSMSSVEVL